MKVRKKNSASIAVRVQGAIACFTRPELKAERVSYSLMTPSAARGVLEAVFWKPAIRWRIDRIKVLQPIRWIAFRRNEVGSRASPPAGAVIDKGGVAPVLIVEDDRAQRNTVALRDVDYIIEAHFELTERAGPEENITKFTEMFNRRLERGQHFHQPYLGCREFVAEVGPANGDLPAPIDHSQDLGLMLWDIDFGKDRNRPRFFHARLEQGVLEVPTNPEATIASRKEVAT